jgi:hypothetical protein
MNMTVDTLCDLGKILVVPRREVRTTTVVAVGGTCIGRSQRIGNRSWVRGLEYIDISIRGVGTQISTSEESRLQVRGNPQAEAVVSCYLAELITLGAAAY